MNLHEYQAKQLFREYGISVPRGHVIRSIEAVDMAIKELGGDSWVVKAQVHAGGRGKGGGVKRVSGKAALKDAAQLMLGSNLVTHQTTAAGLPVHQLLIEELSTIKQELYLGALIDRSRQRVVFVASPVGGMDIEEVAKTQPDKIFTIHVDPGVGLMPYQCRQLGFAMGFSAPLMREFTEIMQGLYRAFIDKDLGLIEINPLIVTEDDHLVALDAKLNIDDNALFRQSALAALADPSQEDAREHEAHQSELNYVSLEGNIGCMVNGAGLAMATMDLIKLHGGDPANFLDVGGGITMERVVTAFKLVVSDSNVKAILVNIFGGIVRCDLIAEGIVQAMQEVQLQIPVIVRLEGTNVNLGRKILSDSGLTVIPAEGLADAAAKAVRAARGGV